MKTEGGFSLLEMIVVVSLFGLAGATFVSFLFASILGNSKAEIVKDVRQNGSWALAVMEGLIRTAVDLESQCTAAQTITVRNRDNALTTFDCSGNRIASNSAYLTSSNLVVSDCSIVCDGEVGTSPTVTIHFDLSRAQSEDLRTSEKAVIEFETTVIIRNVILDSIDLPS